MSDETTTQEFDPETRRVYRENALLRRRCEILERMVAQMYAPDDPRTKYDAAVAELAALDHEHAKPKEQT